MRVRDFRTAVVVAVVCVALPLAALAAQQLKLGKSDFDWKDSEQEVAEFAWAAEVINESSADAEVEVSLEARDGNCRGHDDGRTGRFVALRQGR
jgi:hypothetical protein